jgi:hypothetical protein
VAKKLGMGGGVGAVKKSTAKHDLISFDD